MSGRRGEGRASPRADGGERAFWRDDGGLWARERGNVAAADEAAPSGEPPPRYEADVVDPPITDVWQRRGWCWKGGRRGTLLAAPRGPAAVAGWGDVFAADADAGSMTKLGQVLKFQVCIWERHD